jgi:hypothetical protein
MRWTPARDNGIDVPEWKCHRPLKREESSTVQITTVGLDLAKSVFQLHGSNARGRAVLRKQLRRDQLIPFFANLPTCVIYIEACVDLTTGRASSRFSVASDSAIIKRYGPYEDLPRVVVTSKRPLSPGPDGYDSCWLARSTAGSP